MAKKEELMEPDVVLSPTTQKSEIPLGEHMAVEAPDTPEKADAISALGRKRASDAYTIMYNAVLQAQKLLDSPLKLSDAPDGLGATFGDEIIQDNGRHELGKLHNARSFVNYFKREVTSRINSGE